MKEKYLYDRREWGKSGIIVTIIGSAFILLLFDYLDGRKELTLLYGLSMIVLLLLSLIYHFSLRVAITDEKMIFHEGFFPILRRTIFFREVEDIAFKNIKKYAHLYRSTKQSLTTSAWLFNKEIIFKLRYGDSFCISGSDAFMQEILAVIRKSQPHIEID